MKSGTNSRNQVPKVIKAQSFVLTDTDGNERSKLAVTRDGSTVLTMFDGKHKKRLTVEVTADGGATINFFSRKEVYSHPKDTPPDESKTVLRMKIGCDSPDPEFIKEMNSAGYYNPEIEMFDGEGKRRAISRLRFGVYPVGDGFLDLQGRDLQNSIALNPERGILMWQEKCQAHYSAVKPPPIPTRYARAPKTVGDEFAKLCDDLAEPLRRFLDHEVMRGEMAGRIADAITEAANILAPGVSNAQFAVDSLHTLARACKSED